MRYDIIKTEKYLLISDDSEIKGYYYDEYIKKVRHSGEAEYAENSITKNIVAHLPLNGAPYFDGVPVLPSLEDDVIGTPLEEYIRERHTQEECIGFIDGYKNAREKYKFTEEDVVRIVEKSRETGLTAEYLMLSYQQPKLPIEFVCEIEPEYKYIGSTKEVKGSGDRIKNKNAGKPKIITNSEGRVELVGRYIYE